MLFILLLLALDCITCITVKSRNRAACTLVKTTLYCYGGGSLSDRPNTYTILEDHISIDLATTSFELNHAVTKWTVDNSGLEPRWGHAMTALANDTGYVMVTGSSSTGDGKSMLRNSTVLYTPDRHWTTLPSLPDTFAASSVLDANGTVWVYGGLLPLDNKTLILDGFYNDKMNVTNVTLPNTLYGLDTKTWKWTQLALPTQYSARADHGAAIVGTKMYIVGGMTLGTDSRMYSPMNQILVFDTLSRQWQQVTTLGNTPSQRRAFSVTFLPHRNQIVIYGGIFDTGGRSLRQPLDDICYTLTMNNLTWAKIDVHSQSGDKSILGAGQIYGHSSVLYKTDLFIMFGVDEKEEYRDDVNVLDTLTWQWKSSHDAPSTIWTPPAIAGLVIGLLIGIFLIICGFWFKKRRQADENYHPYLFPVKKRANDPFVMDDVEDPRLRMDPGRPIYQEETTQVAQEGDTTILGSQADEKKVDSSTLAHRHMSQESTFTSFSGTTTKPDLPEHIIERIKPDSDH